MPDTSDMSFDLPISASLPGVGERIIRISVAIRRESGKDILAKAFTHQIPQLAD